MSEERPETCEMCGAPVVWCKCGMSEDIVERLRDLKKWYGFIMTTERMISSNQTIEAAAAEIERLTAADLWNILDQFQSHLIDNDENNPLINMLSNWMRELEAVDEDLPL